MSVELVTTVQARAHLRLDEGDSSGAPDDVWLETWIPAASELVRNYVKRDRNLYEWERDSHGDIIVDSAGEPIVVFDSAGRPIVRAAVRAATLLYLGILYRDRDGTEMEKWDPGYVPRPVMSLLYPLRDPALR